ncbi:MAG: dihydroneopterin aldolase [Acidimicrobiales bacterium]|nr:dihydroneopterin aldolase [Acidimicrobiales bacterium]
MTGPEADRIELRGIRAVGICGALPEERERAQPFEIDLDVVADLAPAGASDDLADTVDYGDLAQVVSTIVDETRFVLLERLAEAIATAVLASQHVRAVTVTVRKLRPPVPVHLDTAGVTIARTRGG